MRSFVTWPCWSGLKSENRQPTTESVCPIRFSQEVFTWAVACMFSLLVSSRDGSGASHECGKKVDNGSVRTSNIVWCFCRHPVSGKAPINHLLWHCLVARISTAQCQEAVRPVVSKNASGAFFEHHTIPVKWLVSPSELRLRPIRSSKIWKV